MKKQVDLTTLLKELPLCLCIFTLAHVGENGEPFGLALLLGLCTAGFSFLPSFSAFLLSAFLAGGTTLFWLYAGGGILLYFALALRKMLFGKHVRGKLLLPFSAFIAGVGLYAELYEFTTYPLPFSFTILEEATFQKAVISLTVVLFGSVCIVAASAARERLLQRRMRTPEAIFSLLVLVLSGIGFFKFFGVNAYMGMAFYILLMFCTVTKDAWGTVCAFVLSLPCLLLSSDACQTFFLYGIALVLFSKSGKLGEAFALLCCYFAVGYLDGVYWQEAPLLIAWLLCALLPVIAFLMTPQAVLTRAEHALIFYKERHLPRLAVNRNREAVAERLFEISGLFRQINDTFLTLGNVDGDTSAKAYMQNRVLGSTCKNCSGYGSCLNAGLLPILEKMLNVGVIKGKVSLVDIPPSLAELCGRQSDLLYSINNQLAEYKSYMQDAEAASCGRQLLANQALGVSEIAKNLALEQSEPMTAYSKKERMLETALLNVGIVCSEIMLYGSDEPIVSLVMQGNGNVKKLSAVVSKVLNAPFCLAEKLTLAKNRYYCTLKRKPSFDAAFGIASAIKAGEQFSGDTHTITKIDEKRFLVALSDGMGSGEYAKHVSSCTISLLESFYRAKMPTELTLSTINRLLSFSKEETFACVDIAVVDLDRGCADVVKIGAPTGFILSDNSLQILESDSLPLGILERVHPATACHPFKAGDTLVFLSDGITEAFFSTVELYDTVQAIPRSNPQNFADQLLKIAIERYGGEAKDDMTVLAVCIFPSR